MANLYCCNPIIGFQITTNFAHVLMVQQQLDWNMDKSKTKFPLNLKCDESPVTCSPGLLQGEWLYAVVACQGWGPHGNVMLVLLGSIQVLLCPTSVSWTFIAIFIPVWWCAFDFNLGYKWRIHIALSWKIAWLFGYYGMSYCNNCLAAMVP